MPTLHAASPFKIRWQMSKIVTNHVDVMHAPIRNRFSYEKWARKYSKKAQSMRRQQLAQRSRTRIEPGQHAANASMQKSPNRTSIRRTGEKTPTCYPKVYHYQGRSKKENDGRGADISPHTRWPCMRYDAKESAKAEDPYLFSSTCFIPPFR